MIQFARYWAPMLPLVPLTVLTFMPTGKPEPVVISLPKSDLIVIIASTLFSSIRRMASSGLLHMSTSRKYPEDVHFSSKREDSPLLLPSTTARLILRISMLTANGNTSIMSTGNIRAILGSPGSLKNCLNSFSRRYFHITLSFIEAWS